MKCSAPVPLKNGFKILLISPKKENTSCGQFDCNGCQWWQIIDDISQMQITLSMIKENFYKLLNSWKIVYLPARCMYAWCVSNSDICYRWLKTFSLLCHCPAEDVLAIFSAFLWICYYTGKTCYRHVIATFQGYRGRAWMDYWTLRKRTGGPWASV